MVKVKVLIVLYLYFDWNYPNTSSLAALLYCSVSLCWISKGTTAYSLNCMVNLALPWVIERNEEE